MLLFRLFLGTSDRTQRTLHAELEGGLDRPCLVARGPASVFGPMNRRQLRLRLRMLSNCIQLAGRGTGQSASRPRMASDLKSPFHLCVHLSAGVQCNKRGIDCTVVFGAIAEPARLYGCFAMHAIVVFIASHCTTKRELEDRAATAGEKFGNLRRFSLTPILVR